MKTSKKIIPLPLNSNEREQLIEAIEITIENWKEINTAEDFITRLECNICKWSNKFVKALAKQYRIKLTYRDDICRFCPVYLLNHNRLSCSIVDNMLTKIIKGEDISEEFPAFKQQIDKEAERLLLIHKSQIGTSKYRKHILEMVKLSYKVQKRRRKENASKTPNTHSRNKQK